MGNYRKYQNKIFNHMTDKRLESKICKEFITLNNKKKKNLIFKKVISHTLWLSAPRSKVSIFSSQETELYLSFNMLFKQIQPTLHLFYLNALKNLFQALPAVEFRHLSKFSIILFLVQWSSNPSSIPCSSYYYFTSVSSYS